MYGSGAQFPKVSFLSIDYTQIPLDSFFIGFDLDNDGKLSKIDSYGNITVIESTLGGPTGPTGASAYDSWIGDGNTGTVQDFLDSIVGPTGPGGSGGGDVGHDTFIAADETLTIPAGYQYWIYGDLFVEGLVDNYGEIAIANGTLSVLPGGQVNNIDDGVIKIISLPTNIVNGPTGATGPIGLAGPTGATGPMSTEGVDGSNNLRWIYAGVGLNTIVDPSTYFNIKIGEGTISISETALNSIIAGPWLNSIQLGDYISVYAVGQSDLLRIYEVTSIVDQGSYIDFDVNIISLNGTFSFPQVCGISFVKNGAAGPTGATGLSGDTGATGETGPTGQIGPIGPNSLIFKYGTPASTDGTWGANNPTFPSISQISIRETSYLGYSGNLGASGNASNWLSAISVGDIIQIVDVDESDKFGIYSVTSTVDAGQFRVFDVVLIIAGGGALLSSTQYYSINYVKNGVTGATGPIGGTGATGPAGSPGYLVYTALLTQVGTADPTVTILENTLGNIVWTRDSTGIYFGTLANAFTENKTWFSVITNGNSTDADETLAIYWNNSSQIHIQTGLGTVRTDGRLYLNSIEIRVYP